ncbi:MAG: hypothetical protein KIT12_03640 [Trueperaceae bacterium]|nr:hypothetical protein [Trueperaceae bacterium]
MAFWRPKDRDLREREWRAFAGAFELEPAPALAETLREDLDLGPGAIATVYERARPDQPDTVVFEQANDRDGPAGTLTGLRIGVVVRSSVEHSSVSLRASARRHKILEGLVAGRSGAQRLDGAFDPEFDAAVSVYAREVDQATALLTRPVRTVLARLLGEADEVVASATASHAKGSVPRHANGAPPSVAIGPLNLYLALEVGVPFELDALGLLMADLLSLHAALLSASGKGR